MPFYLIFKSTNGNQWYWSGASFTRSLKKVATYNSLKEVRDAIKQAEKKSPSLFKTHPLNQCTIINASSQKQHPAADPNETNFCLARRLSYDSSWTFLTSKNTFAKFKKKGMIFQPNKEELVKRAKPFWKSSETQFAIFNGNEELVEYVDIEPAVSDVESTPEVTVDEIKQAFDILIKAKAYAKKLKDEIKKQDNPIVIDLLHYIELNDLTDEQKIATINKIQELRQERRKVKDLYLYVSSITNHIDIDAIATDIKDSHVEEGDNRSYNYRTREIRSFTQKLSGTELDIPSVIATLK